MTDFIPFPEGNTGPFKQIHSDYFYEGQRIKVLVDAVGSTSGITGSATDTETITTFSEYIIGGSGFSGPVPVLANVGDSEAAGYTYEAIARWATPTRQTVSTGELDILVAADHYEGIDRVEFSCNDGPNTVVTDTTYVDYLKSDVYKAKIDVSQFDDNTYNEVRATVYPNSGIPTILGGTFGESSQNNRNGIESLYFLKLDSRPEVWFDINHSGSTLGTQANPFTDFRDAFLELASLSPTNPDTGNTDCAGSIIHCASGQTFDWDWDRSFPFNSTVRTERGFVEIRNSSGDPEDVIITGKSTTGTDQDLHFSGCKFVVPREDPGIVIRGVNENAVWFAGCSFDGNFRGPSAVYHFTNNFGYGIQATDCSGVRIYDAFAGAGLNYNCHVDGAIRDQSRSRSMFNCSIKNMNSDTYLEEIRDIIEFTSESYTGQNDGTEYVGESLLSASGDPLWDEYRLVNLTASGSTLDFLFNANQSARDAQGTKTIQFVIDGVTYAVPRSERTLDEPSVYYSGASADVVIAELLGVTSGVSFDIDLTFIPEPPHPDVYQSNEVNAPVENVIVWALEATDNIYGQGIFVSGSTTYWRGASFKDVIINTTANNTDNTFININLNKPVNHFMIRNSKFTGGQARMDDMPGSDDGHEYVGDLVLMEDVYKINPADNTVTAPLFLYPDGPGGGFWDGQPINEHPPDLPWTSELVGLSGAAGEGVTGNVPYPTNIEYKATTGVMNLSIDVDKELRISGPLLDNDLPVLGENDIVEALFTIRGGSGSYGITHQWYLNGSATGNNATTFDVSPHSGGSTFYVEITVEDEEGSTAGATSEIGTIIEPVSFTSVTISPDPVGFTGTVEFTISGLTGTNYITEDTGTINDGTDTGEIQKQFTITSGQTTDGPQSGSTFDLGPLGLTAGLTLSGSVVFTNNAGSTTGFSNVITIE